MHPDPKHILITGAGSGLGRGLTKIFSDHGHRLVLVDRDRAALDATLAALDLGGAFARDFCLDIGDSASIDRMIASLDGDVIDILINNAGLQNVSPLEEFTEERWDTLVDVMLKGTFLLTKAVLPGMKKNHFGRIINIGSIHSLIASPYKSAYVAAKHGAIGLAKVTALETAGTDVTVNTICPAYIRTPLVDRQIKDQARAHGISEQEVIDKIMLAPMPKKVFITIEEVAETINFLISNSARNITGQTIVIDGGWTIQ